MVCIYCHHKTSVTNSRPQNKGLSTWRRRQCSNCGAIFTTQEKAQLDGSIVIELENKVLQNFIRDKLLISIVKSCGHRPNSVTDASGITDTIISTILARKSALLPINELKEIAYDSLNRFDKVSATYYAAYYRLELQ